jgi:hypothetical protein
VTVTRRYHPLEGQSFEVTIGGPTRIVVRLANGTTMGLPRTWTDADGSPASTHADRVFSVEALLELIERVDALGRRS